MICKKINILKHLLKISLMINFLSAIGIPCLAHYIDNTSIIYAILNVTTFVLILFVRKRVRVNGFFKFILLYYIIIIFSCLINKENLITITKEAICALTLILICDSLNKDEFKENISAFTFVLEILTYINFILIILFPNGLYNIGLSRKYYLFDHVNISIRYLLPGCCLTLIRSYLIKNRIDIRAIVYFFIVIISLLFTLPTTALIGFSIFILFIILSNKSKILALMITPFNSIVASGLISFLIIKVKIQNYFAKFIEHFLHRDITFTGRTEIWNRALEVISNKFYLGYGRLDLLERTVILEATSTHNEFLAILFEGGIILMFMIFMTIHNISRKIKQCNNQKISIVLVATLLSYFVMWIAEPFSYTGTILMFLVWLIAYRSPELFNE